MNKKTWYLQKAARDGLSPFWDTYLHAGCYAIKETNENPFKKKKED